MREGNLIIWPDKGSEAGWRRGSLNDRRLMMKGRKRAGV